MTCCPIAILATASDAKALEATIADIARFEAKLEVADAGYRADNAKVKDDIIKAKFAHDQLMDILLVTTIVCQADMFTRAANELNAIVGILPIDRVDQIRKRIENYVVQGGISVAGGAIVTGESGIAAKSIALLTGKATLTELQKNTEAKNAVLDKQNADRAK